MQCDTSEPDALSSSSSRRRLAVTAYVRRRDQYSTWQWKYDQAFGLAQVYCRITDVRSIRGRNPFEHIN